MPISDNAATFLGISNENEFYSAHYLSEVFNGDIKDVLTDWKSREDEDEFFTAPYNRLKSLARQYFAMRERSHREKNVGKINTLQTEYFEALFQALDIPWAPENRRVQSDLHKEDITLPVLGTLPASGASQLWVLGALDIENDGNDPFSLSLRKEQFIGDGPHADGPKNSTWYDLINDIVFKQENPPRWVLLLSDRQAVLIDRFKWLQNRILRFDWDEILGRKDDITLKATAALLHGQSLVPSEGSSLLDGLDENSHKHAYGVSEDLKYALREAIELLGNEAAGQLIQKKDISFTGKSALDAEALSRECLRYMYRLLFLFYIEARPELKYIPHKSEAYRKGYSLESLRDLELVKLTSDESRQGTYLHQSIQKLFMLIHEGYQGERDAELGDGWESRDVHHTFKMAHLDSHLFDPKRTPMINSVKFSNQTLQRIICLMSLTRERSGRGRKRRGRVSYAQLGINQLGAVYEALLSYRGFFATEDLYEVKKAKDTYNELETGYFVPANEIDDYKDDEKVYDKDEQNLQKLKVHPKGKFIYRMAGRDRQKSASYYTPEVLTKCLVKYTLKERLKDLTADEILNLTICEPAMGSAAFLNEAVNQLAEAYLTLKQTELNKRIPHDEYREVLQQVKMHVADHNCYGVDLNPIAVELAEVSLWLNALSETSQVPWFGYQLFNGNSLIGARRQVYRLSRLNAQDKKKHWYNFKPERLDPMNPVREEDQIYHFLLPDPGMVGYKDKEAKKLQPEAFAKIAKWKKEFIKPLDAMEVQLVQQLSGAIDDLWKQHTDMLRADRDRTEDRFAIWGQKTEIYQTSTDQKDKVRSEGIFNTNAKSASPYRRLKLVMDYWCSLWFWPIDKVDLLPDRSSWLFELNLILQGSVYDFGTVQSGFEFAEPEASGEIFPTTGQQSFLDEAENQMILSAREKAAREVKTATGELHLEKLFKQFPRLGLVEQLSGKFKFLHWELAFADIFKDEGGFDIILGNPPWLKVEWNESGILGDYNPQFILRKFDATKLRAERKTAFLNSEDLNQSWFHELVDVEGTQSFLSAFQNYSELRGIQTNLYKCFLPQAWRWGNAKNVSGFLHPEGIFDDPKGGEFRSKTYKRLLSHFQFQNELSLFSEVDHHAKFSINIYGPIKFNDIQFTHLSNLFAPQTIESSFNHDGEGKIPGIKNDQSRWNTDGHYGRLVRIDKKTLETFSILYDDENTSFDKARLSAIHSHELIPVLNKLAVYPASLRDLKGDFFSTEMFHETYAQRDNIIQRQTQFSEDEKERIISGPHLFVGSQFYKNPRAICRLSSDYDCIDLTTMPPDYFPRTNYTPSGEHAEFRRQLPVVPWLEAGESQPRLATDYFRLCLRAMLPPTNERTLFGAIIPKHISHTNACRTYVFSEKRIFELIIFSAGVFSIPFDFWVKTTGRTNLHQMLDNFPVLQKHKTEMAVRVICLTALTSSFSELWKNVWRNAYLNDSWTSPNVILQSGFFGKLNPDWNSEVCLRTDFERRQALLELDVLVAMALGLNLGELLALYNVQFPVMQQYEAETSYDLSGRIVFTPSKGLVGVGLSRKENKKDDPITIEYPDGKTEEKPIGWEDIAPKDDGSPSIPDGTKIHRTVMDDTLPGGPREKIITYEAPFYRPDREEDYRIAWEVFTERFAKQEAEAQPGEST